MATGVWGGAGRRGSCAHAPRRPNVDLERWPRLRAPRRRLASRHRPAARLGGARHRTRGANGDAARENPGDQRRSARAAASPRLLAQCGRQGQLRPLREVRANDAPARRLRHARSLCGLRSRLPPDRGGRRASRGRPCGGWFLSRPARHRAHGPHGRERPPTARSQPRGGRDHGAGRPRGTGRVATPPAESRGLRPRLRTARREEGRLRPPRGQRRRPSHRTGDDATLRYLRHRLVACEPRRRPADKRRTRRARVWRWRQHGHAV